jgi:hypothetical protein
MSHGYPLVARAPFRPAWMRKVVVIKASPDGRYLILGGSIGTLEAGFSCLVTLKMHLYQAWASHRQLLEISGLVTQDWMFDWHRNYAGTIGPGVVDIVFHPHANRFVVAMKDSRILIGEIKVLQSNNNRVCSLLTINAKLI